MSKTVLVGVLLALAATAHADVAAGKAKAAAACAMCHGALGLSMQPGVPNLAGQQEVYLAEQLKHFRNGKRVNEVMTVIARPLSNEEIDNLAAWYASLQIRVEEK
jgi:cytochrome c553